MNKDKAIQLLKRLQDPEPYEPMLTKDAYDAIQMAIDALSADGDTISRKDAIDVIDSFNVFESRSDQIKLEQMIGELPPSQPEQLGTNLAEVGTDCISRQVAISAICSACGKIDCDKMDKCEKLQLPPANCSEFPNSSDTISRAKAIDEIKEIYEWHDNVTKERIIEHFKQLPPVQPEPSQVAKDIARIAENGQDMRVIAQLEIIRCKDCKHWIPYDWMFSEVWRSKNIADYPEDEIGCNYCDMTMKANDFCSRGERKTT